MGVGMRCARALGGRGCSRRRPCARRRSADARPQRSEGIAFRGSAALHDASTPCASLFRPRVSTRGVPVGWRRCVSAAPSNRRADLDRSLRARRCRLVPRARWMARCCWRRPCCCAGGVRATAPDLIRALVDRLQRAWFRACSMLRGLERAQGDEGARDGWWRSRSKVGRHSPAAKSGEQICSARYRAILGCLSRACALLRACVGEARGMDGRYFRDALRRSEWETTEGAR